MLTRRRTEYYFDFTQPFQIHDDIEILKRMGMTMGLHNGTCTAEQLEEAKNMIPAALEAHLIDLYKNPNLYDRSILAHFN